MASIDSTSYFITHRFMVRPAGIEPATLSLEDVPDDKETLEISQEGPNTGDTKGQEEDS